MTDPAGVPQNVEGAPTLVYELWSYTRISHDWHFHGYHVLSLRQVQKYLDFGYHVERSHRSDRTGTLPLFPRLVATAKDPGHGLD
jgi:hypothetical protein